MKDEIIRTLGALANWQGSLSLTDKERVALTFAVEYIKKHEETFEWCHDCKEYDQKEHCCHRWTKVIRDTVDELEKDRRPHGKWKKVGTSVMCSICEHGWGKGHAPKDLKDYNFCPNCGALTISSNSEIEKSKSEESDEENQNPCIKCGTESVCQIICEKRYLWNLRKEGERND